MRKIQRAIISVTDKSGIVEFSKELHSMGVEIISTGGTAELLKKEGINVIPISSYTGFPEMLDGRVKTLHPKIHGGILGIRDSERHKKEMSDFGMPPIDMIVVNLYAFSDTVKKGASLEEAIENIDIGGPTMIRGGAKNFKDVTVVVEPADYPSIIEEMKKSEGCVSLETRFKFAKKVFSLTAGYDGAISNWLNSFEDSAGGGVKKFPDTFSVQFKKIEDLRYGENPHQVAAFYSEIPMPEHTLASSKKLQGKELSFNNILDLTSALTIVSEFHEPACVIIKHNNPCGIAMSKEGLKTAFELALSTDVKSAFGGIVGFNGTVTEELAGFLTEIFLEAVIAPEFTQGAKEVFKTKKNLRVMEAGIGIGIGSRYEIKKVSGGVLIQTIDIESAMDLKVVTQRAPTDDELTDLLFAWNVSKHVKSNAIILAKCGRTIGIGAGQMSRIDSTRIAIMKAEDAGLQVKGSVLSSDAFFPFRDNVTMAAGHGITAIIQPGGSIKDAEVINAADEAGIAMVFTGIRHFRH